MSEKTEGQNVLIVGAGPVGALAALYAAGRGDNVEIYELRSGTSKHLSCPLLDLSGGSRSYFMCVP